MPNSSLQIETVVSAPFDQNAYVIWLEGSRECLIIDPGFEPEGILDVVREHQLEPTAILNTHGHSDHIAGNATMKEQWPEVPLLIGENEADKLTDPRKNLSAGFGVSLISPQADALLSEGQVFSSAGIDLLVHEIPGHSSGHVVFIYRPDSTEPVVLGGDVLFAGSIGRTDFPDGDFAQLAKGIHRWLFALADDAVVYPGHGEPTTIGEEKASNPFVGRPAGWRG